MRAFGLDVSQLESPSGWTRLRLKDVLTFCNRGVAPTYADLDSTGAVAISQKCVIDGAVSPAFGRAIDPAQDAGLATLRSHDVLVNSTGRGTLGRVGILDGVSSDMKLVADGHVTVLRANRDKLEPRYLNYLLGTEDFYRFANESLAVGSTNQTELNRDQLRCLTIILPTLREQRQIANYLDAQCARIDELDHEVSQQLRLLDEHEAAVRDSMVWDGVSETLPLRSLVDPTRPVTYGIVLPGPNVDEGVLIVKGGNVTSGGLAPHRLCRTTVEIEAAYSRSRLRANDLVIAIRGSIGSVEIVPAEIEGANLTQDAARIAPANGVRPKWLAEVMRSGPVFSALEAGSAGATIRGINLRDLRKVRVPKVTEAQQERVVDELTERLTAASALGAEYVRQRGLLREHRQALITAAVTGQFDVSSAA